MARTGLTLAAATLLPAGCGLDVAPLRDAGEELEQDLTACEQAQP